MTVDIVIENGRIVSPSGIMRAGIAIKEGKIVAVSQKPYLPRADVVIDAKGRYVIPGFVDAHTHADREYFTKTATLKECFKKETKAAAAGGVTTIGVMPITSSILDDFENYRGACDERAIVDSVFSFYASVPRHIKELHRCPELGIVTIGELGGYKGPQADEVGLGYVDDAMMFNMFEIISKWGPPGRAMLHAENIDIILMLRDRIMGEGRRDCRAWTASRPRFCEAEKMMCYVELAKAARCPIYFVHVTIREGVDIIAKAKSEGVDIVGETCPQYLTHTQDSFKEYPVYANANPPLRDSEDNESLWRGIREGVIECVATDHAPMNKAEKGSDIMNSPMGFGNTLSTWMPAMLSEGVNKGRITIEKMVEVCCENPAKYLGILPKKGVISVGSDADIVIVDMEKKLIPKASELYSHSDINIYEILGWELKGWPILTMVRGNIVMENGKVIGREGTGKYIKRKLLGGE